MPLVKKITRQLAVGLFKRHSDWLLIQADGGSQAEVIRRLIDAEIARERVAIESTRD